MELSGGAYIFIITLNTPIKQNKDENNFACIFFVENAILELEGREILWIFQPCIKDRKKS